MRRGCSRIGLRRLALWVVGIGSMAGRRGGPKEGGEEVAPEVAEPFEDFCGWRGGGNCVGRL